MEGKKTNKIVKSFAIIIIIAIVILIVALVVANMQNNNTKSTSNDIKENVNPYKTSKQYDGIYSFKMESTNNPGYNYLCAGIVTLNDGKCKAKYIVKSENSTYDNEYEFNGFCGLNDKDESSFYFNIKDDSYIYKCKQIDKGLNCELKSTFDLSGGTNANLNLELLEEKEDLDRFYSKFVKEEKDKWKAEVERIKVEEQARKEAEEKAKKEAEERNFKESCQTYTFEQMARNPENFRGTNVKLTGEVVQVIQGTLSTKLRVNITKKGSYSTYYTDTIYVDYSPVEGEDKILEKDIITIYGTSQGEYTYTSTIGAQVTLPYISAKYIVLKK